MGMFLDVLKYRYVSASCIKLVDGKDNLPQM